MMQGTFDPLVLMTAAITKHMNSCRFSHSPYLSSPLPSRPQFIRICVAACPSQVTREASDTWDYSFVLRYPMSGCSSGFQLKRPGAGAGAAVHDASDLPWETNKVMMPLWPRSVGIARVNGVFPLTDIFELAWVWNEENVSPCTGKGAFQSSSIRYHYAITITIVTRNSMGRECSGAYLWRTMSSDISVVDRPTFTLWQSMSQMLKMSNPFVHILYVYISNLSSFLF